MVAMWQVPITSIEIAMIDSTTKPTVKTGNILKQTVITGITPRQTVTAGITLRHRAISIII